MASKKHQRLLREGSDRHHYYWPKKLYGKFNKVITMSYGAHHAYHGYYMAHCKNPDSRPCKEGDFCKYEGICCYCQTNFGYGKRVI